MEINKKLLRYLFGGVIVCIVVYWLLHETGRLVSVIQWIGALLSPFVIGAALAFILNVPMRSIEGLLKGIKKRGLRRGLSILLTFAAIILVLTLVIVLIVPQIDATIDSLRAALPGFFSRIETGVTNFLKNNPEFTQWIQDNTDLEKLDWMSIVQKAAQIAGNSVSSIFSGAVSAVGSVINGIFNAIISLVFALYCLSTKETLARQGRRVLYAIFPERICDKTIRILRLTNSTFSNFIGGQCLEAVILGCMFAVTMPIFGMPYTPLVSVLVSVTALVPLVGAFVGCFFGALFILVNSPVMAFWFVVLFLVLQQIEGNIIYPRVVGTSIGLPGMWVLVAVTVGGSTMGIGGMLVMIPLASVLYALMREWTAHRLEKRGIAQEKLQDQPPELRSKFKEKRHRTKLKRLLKRKSKKEGENHE